VARVVSATTVPGPLLRNSKAVLPSGVVTGVVESVAAPKKRRQADATEGETGGVPGSVVTVPLLVFTAAARPEAASIRAQSIIEKQERGMGDVRVGGH